MAGQHDIDRGAAFKYKAWLEAGGDKAVVQRHVEAWLEKRGKLGVARFVYNAWLESGGETAVIEKYVTIWCKANDTAREAPYLRKKWEKANKQGA